MSATRPPGDAPERGNFQSPDPRDKKVQIVANVAMVPCQDQPPPPAPDATETVERRKAGQRREGKKV